VEEGKEGNYGFGGVVLVGASRAWPCRTHHGLHNGMLLEANREKVRKQEWIPTELLALPLIFDGGLFSIFPICLAEYGAEKLN
jgi:hypothetical protein